MASGAQVAGSVYDGIYELPPEMEAPPVIANVPPPMRAFSLARSFFGGQKRPSDGKL